MSRSTSLPFRSAGSVSLMNASATAANAFWLGFPDLGRAPHGTARTRSPAASEGSGRAQNVHGVKRMRYPKGILNPDKVL
jgi:hypothetical protein